MPIIGKSTKDNPTYTVNEREGYPNQIIITAKPAIQLNHGKSHPLPGKQLLITAQSASAFKLLAAHNIKNPFIKQLEGHRILAHRTKIIPIRVVISKEASDGYVCRHPETARGTLFPEPVVELFYTGDERFLTMVWDIKKVMYNLYQNNKPLIQENLIRLTMDPRLPSTTQEVQKMINICSEAAKVIDIEWAHLGYFMSYINFEIGYDRNKSISICGLINSDNYGLRKDIEGPDISSSTLYELSELTPEKLDSILANCALVADACLNFKIKEPAILEALTPKK